MLSKRMLVIVGVIFLFVASIVDPFTIQQPIPSMVSGASRLILWRRYKTSLQIPFVLSEALGIRIFPTFRPFKKTSSSRKELQQALARIGRFQEIELANSRLRRLLDFKVNFGSSVDCG